MTDSLFNYLYDHKLFIVIVIVVFFLIVGIGFKILFRSYTLWYYRINTIVTELQENNALLRGIQEELMKKNIQSPSSQQKQEEHSKYMPR